MKIKIASVPFRAFIAWSCQGNKNINHVDNFLAMQYEYDTTDLLLDKDNDVPSKKTFEIWWFQNPDIDIVSINPGPNGFYEIVSRIEDVEYSQDYDLDELKIGELFKYAI